MARDNTPTSRLALERELRKRGNSATRYVDFGVILHVVVADDNGVELVSGAPPLRIIRSHHRGGMVDTRSRPACFCGPSLNPVVWYCSEGQEQIILHDELGIYAQLVYGSEGAGKTSVLAMWLVFQLLAVLGERKEIGQTAPTEARLAMVRDELVKICPLAWYRYHASKDLFVFADRTKIRLVSSHRKSEAGGSPIQGYNWTACGRDEGQDQLAVHNDIESRGRSAYKGKYNQLITATAKDSSSWRSMRDKLLGSGLWKKRTLLGVESPFIWPSFWADKKRTMDPRAYAMRVEAKDVSDDLAVYFNWQRQRHVARLPAVDVTPSVLEHLRSRFGGGGFNILAGHDPGRIYNTTIFFRLYMLNGKPTWFVIGELVTKQTDNHVHAQAIKDYVERRFGGGDIAPKLMIYCDPHGKGDTQTDYQTVYTAFQKEGLDILSPSPPNVKISRSARVAMVNRLMGDKEGNVGLCVAVDEAGNVAAPGLVESFETLAKDPQGLKVEGVVTKNATDNTHGPAATGYALWQFERELLTLQTQQKAMEYAKRIGWRMAA